MSTHINSKKGIDLGRQSESDGEDAIPIEVERGVNEINPNLLKNLSKVQRREVLTTFSLMQMKSHSGPLPQPEIFEGYERVLPGCAERILLMAEKQQNHRMGLEKMHLGEQLFQSKLGQIFGLLIAGICIGTGAFLVMNGYELADSILFSTTLLGLVTVFVIGKRSQQV